jgi:hypothetical protein
MTLPFAGHPVGARDLKQARSDEDKIHSAYRFLLADLMPFGKNAVIRLEHGGINQSSEHYTTVTYWYGAPAPSLIKTDGLDIGNAESERSHHYHSPEASKPYEVVSRYELGPDTYYVQNGKIQFPEEFRSRGAPSASQTNGANVITIYPAQADTGRKTVTRSEFTLKIEPKNFGVLIRRKLDLQYPNQRARVLIADASESNGAIAESSWKEAGAWYVAGGNSAVYSDPKGELGEALHNVQTSNRRFRDDEFLVPRDLTEGRSSIRVRVEFTPVKRPLFPGHPLPELAWTEFQYDAYCFVLPDWNVEPR